MSELDGTERLVTSLVRFRFLAQDALKTDLSCKQFSKISRKWVTGNGRDIPTLPHAIEML